MKHTTVAIDLAKTVFEVAISERAGQVSRRRRMTRAQISRFASEGPQSTILMEACGSAHFWGREFRRCGHEVRLLPAHHVARYRIGEKTDRRDAKALLEADRNEEIFPVPIKTTDQQVMASLHRLRSRWMSSRTAGLNTLRGLLREFGLTIPVGSKRVVPQVLSWLRDGTIHPGLAPVLEEAAQEVLDLEGRIRVCERQLEALAQSSDAVRRLRSIPGIGLLTATAFVSFIGDPRRFRNGRRFSSYLGLVPKEFSSGRTIRRGSIHKRGDGYLRTLLIHGARSVLSRAKRKEGVDSLEKWALDLERSKGHNIAAVALANRMARIAWRVWSRESGYEVRP